MSGEGMPLPGLDDIGDAATAKPKKKTSPPRAKKTVEKPKPRKAAKKRTQTMSAEKTATVTVAVPQDVAREFKAIAGFLGTVEGERVTIGDTMRRALESLAASDPTLDLVLRAAREKRGES